MCRIIYGNQQASKSKHNHTHDALRRCCHLQTEDPLSEQLQLLNPPWRKKKKKEKKKNDHQETGENQGLGDVYGVCLYM